MLLDADKEAQVITTTYLQTKIQNDVLTSRGHIDFQSRDASMESLE
jgi:hypothetical protein